MAFLTISSSRHRENIDIDKIHRRLKFDDCDPKMKPIPRTLILPFNFFGIVLKKSLNQDIRHDCFILLTNCFILDKFTIKIYN